MTLAPGVTVVIPHIPVRTEHISRALRSVFSQTLPADFVTVVSDTEHHGAAPTRNRAIAGIATEWVAWLDDDDEFYPGHLKRCLAAARVYDADVVYPGCDVERDGRLIPVEEEWGRFGKDFDENILRDHSYIPVTSLMRTELVQKTEGFRKPPGSDYEDWGMYLQLLDLGAKFHHLPLKTWRWHHGEHSTSGRGDRW